ncbi:MAG: FAD-binding oxidoreductase [Candidatus Dormiibacterota bacterium]
MVVATEVPGDAMESVSYWLDSLQPIRARPALDSDIEADVAVVGAGFTGLWTAYELQRREPGLRIAILESRFVGFGASGRNGSWCVPELNASLELLSSRFGRDRALALHRALLATPGEVERSLGEEGIEADFSRSGVLKVARGRYQLPLLKAELRSYREAGVSDAYSWLDRAAARQKLDVAGVEAALYTPNGATLHPGKAVRGLAEAVERRGATVYENTRVVRVRKGSPVRVETERGVVRAKVAVLALEGYLSQLAGYHRRVLPLYSLISITEPISERDLASVNWSERMCVGSMRLSVDYFARTADGRILVGGRGAPYSYGSRILTSREHHQATHANLQRMFREWFPGLSSVRFSQSWGGVLGMPRDWIPQIGFQPSSGLAFAYGYTGHGVATTNLSGRTLADLITARETELTSLALVGHHSPDWEPEPLRWIGVRYVQAALARLDARGERTGRAPSRWDPAMRMAAN